MKAKLLLAGIFVFQYGAALCQNCENQRTITLDFKNKCFQKSTFDDWDLKKGDYYLVQVTGINLNLYSVQIDKEDSTIVSNVSIPIFDVFGLESIDQVIAGISKSTSAAQGLALEKAQLTILLEQLNSEKSAKINERTQLESLKGVKETELKIMKSKITN